MFSSFVFSATCLFPQKNFGIVVKHILIHFGVDHISVPVAFAAEAIRVIYIS